MFTAIELKTQPKVCLPPTMTADCYICLESTPTPVRFCCTLCAHPSCIKLMEAKTGCTVCPACQHPYPQPHTTADVDQAGRREHIGVLICTCASVSLVFYILGFELLLFHFLATEFHLYRPTLSCAFFVFGVATSLTVCRLRSLQYQNVSMATTRTTTTEFADSAA